VLHLTPGAVSRQIGVLEEHLKRSLFARGTGSTAVLTSEGRRLHERALDKMEAIVDLLAGAGRRSPDRRSILLIDTSVTLAMHWLIPQLRSFRKCRPDIVVQVQTVEGDVNPATPADIFIRREKSELRTLQSSRFMTERSVLVANPGLIESPVSIEREGVLPNLTLMRVARIGARSRPDLWPRWATHFGFEDDSLEPTLEFDNTVLAIQACAQGLGAMVVPELFVAPMVESGTLRSLHPGKIETGSYSFAVGRHRDSACVRAFTEWLGIIGQG